MIQVTNKPLMLASQSIETITNFDFVLKTFSEQTYFIEDRIAVIPIHGLLTKRNEMICGVTSYEEIQATISQALKDEQVSCVLLDIDSPGGEVGGVFDLVDYIYTAKNQKPIYAYANDSAFSAAYAIASACTKIFVNRTSGVGSIGVIATHISVSEAEQREGIKYTTIFAGAKKNDLSPHEPLTERAIADLQQEVSRLYDIFVQSVSRNRGISSSKIYETEAGIYFGLNAISEGLADVITNDPISLIKKSEKLGVMPSNVSQLEMKGEKMAENMDKMESGEVEKYRAEILEIAKLCKLARCENRIPEFVMQGFNAEQVKEKLLASMETQEEIHSTHLKQAERENPVIAAAKARQHDVASKN